MESYKFNWGNTPKHKMILWMFIIYNVFYSLYMLGYFGRSMYLGTLFAFLGVMAYVYMKDRDSYILRSSDLFISEYKTSLVGIFVISAISIFLQIWYRDYCSYFVTYILYLIIPPTMAFLWINTTEKNERYAYFVIQLIRNIFYFVWANRGNFTVANILSIRWEDSQSSVFETEFAHDFFFLEIIFLLLGKTKIGIVCMLLCMLNFKRLSFILSVAYFILWMLIMHRKKIYNKVVELKNVNIVLVSIIGVLLCIMPMAETLLLSDTVQDLFLEKFGMTLNQFTTGRTGLIEDALAGMPYFNGLGSTTEFMKTHPNHTMRQLGSIHCDWISLYLETTILGVVAYTTSMLRIFRKNIIVFFLMMYMFLSLITTHFFDQQRIWSLLYMFAAFMYCMNAKEE